jgi:hypothetical protein
MRLLLDLANAISRPGVAQLGTVLAVEALIAGKDAAEASVPNKKEAAKAAVITRYIIDITHQPSTSGRTFAPG